MSTKAMADILLRMLTDRKFAEAVLEDSECTLRQYREDLTEEEFDALSACIPPDDVDALQKTPHVGAWRMLAGNIDELDDSTKARLNDVLAERSAGSGFIPVTGS